MKKTFLTRRNALLAPGSLSWGSYSFGVVLLFVILRFLAPNVFWQMTAPIFKSADAFAGAGHAFFSSFGDRAALVVANEDLVRENSILAIENQTLREKNATYDSLLATPTPKATARIIADVVARPPVSAYDTLLLARGTTAGIVTGMEVFALPSDTTITGGVPIGYVSAATTNDAQVTLFSSPGLESAAWVGATKTPILLDGLGGGVFGAVIARSANIQVGDVVYAPGPGFIALGKVSRIDSDPSSPSVMLQIAPLLNPATTRSVLLVSVGAAFLGLKPAASL